MFKVAIFVMFSHFYSKKNLFFKSILITLIELNNPFKSVARKTFFCDVLKSFVEVMLNFRKNFAKSKSHARDPIKPRPFVPVVLRFHYFHSPPDARLMSA